MCLFFRYTSAFVGMATMGKDMTVERLKQRLNKALNSIKPAEANHDIEDTIHNKWKEVDDEILKKIEKSDELKFPNNKVSIELMVHPGFPCRSSDSAGCGAGPDSFSLSDDRQHEIIVICSDELSEFFAEVRFKKHASITRARR